MRKMIHCFSILSGTNKMDLSSIEYCLPSSSQLCTELGCSKRASFNIVGMKCGIRCAKHKLSGMINVKHVRCIEPGCMKHPIYNVVGETKPLFCIKHKLSDMIDVIHKRCLASGCMKHPIYNVVGETKALFCIKHKLPDMIDVINKRCLEQGCSTRPSYNVAGETKGLFCLAHKKPDMIDVINKRCLEPGCTKNPTYNVAGETKGLFCNYHKKLDMIDVINKRCFEPGCMKRPIYNIVGETKGLFCLAHKKPDMIDVKNKLCLTPLCPTHASNPAYEGHCMPCFVNNPANFGKPVFRNYKTKERDVVDRVQVLFPDVDWRADQRISDGCSKRRPDLFLDMGSHICIVEIDENKHEAYDCSCENKRIQEIWNDVGCRPIIFIRFNPDSYIDVNNVKHTSCWRNNKLGVCRVPKSKEVEWHQRIETLIEAIRIWMVMVPDKPVETVELFY
jgi:hypothetical protein